MKRTIHLVICMMFACLSARADGGVVRIRQASGPFLVTVFTDSAPLRVGSIDTGVLVQDRATGGVILDAIVNLVFRPVDGTSPGFVIRATRARARNKLLHAATADVPAPGWWAIQVFVRRGGEEVVLATQLFVMPTAPHCATIWPFLIFPPFAIGLYVLHQRRRGMQPPACEASALRLSSCPVLGDYPQLKQEGAIW
jgi:hypothetical protein